jgi:tetratricopeptide (TPR) repeat protein
LASLDASMMDQIEAILESYLSFDFQEKAPSLEDVSLRNWMSEVLTLCKNAASFQQANAIIEPRNNEYSSSIDFNDKVPYSSLLLFYVFYKWGKYAEATKWVTDAIDEFAQRGMAQNQIISLWLRALTFEEQEHVEDAQEDLKYALKLIEKKLCDCKRFIRMKVNQTKCEKIQRELLIANNRLGKNLRSNMSINHES